MLSLVNIFVVWVCIGGTAVDCGYVSFSSHICCMDVHR